MHNEQAEKVNDEQQSTMHRVGPILLERVVEALIFAADDPVTAAELSKSYSDISGEDPPSPAEIQSVIDDINAEYELSYRSFRIRAWAGGFRMSTTQDMAPYVKAFHEQDRKRKLTHSLLETIAILAYRQPAAKSDIEFVRGVSCDYSIRRLLEYGLIDVVGRSDSIGRPLLYGTTDRFLELFGLNTVTDLPNLREIEEILDDPAFHKERAKLLMSSGLDSLSQGLGDGETEESSSTGGSDDETA